MTQTLPIIATKFNLLTINSLLNVAVLILNELVKFKHLLTKGDRVARCR